MQSKESLACEVEGYFGAAPAGHSDACLYLHLLAFGIIGKCKLAFTPMLVCVYTQIAHKKFCKLSFTRKKFCKFVFTQKSGRITRLIVVSGR